MQEPPSHEAQRNASEAEVKAQDRAEAAKELIEAAKKRKEVMELDETETKQRKNKEGQRSQIGLGVLFVLFAVALFFFQPLAVAYIIGSFAIGAILLLFPILQSFFDKNRRKMPFFALFGISFLAGTGLALFGAGLAVSLLFTGPFALPLLVLIGVFSPFVLFALGKLLQSLIKGVTSNPRFLSATIGVLSLASAVVISAFFPALLIALPWLLPVLFAAGALLLLGAIIRSLRDPNSNLWKDHKLLVLFGVGITIGAFLFLFGPLLGLVFLAGPFGLPLLVALGILGPFLLGGLVRLAMMVRDNPRTFTTLLGTATLLTAVVLSTFFPALLIALPWLLPVFFVVGAICILGAMLRSLFSKSESGERVKWADRPESFRIAVFLGVGLVVGVGLALFAPFGLLVAGALGSLLLLGAVLLGTLALYYIGRSLIRSAVAAWETIKNIGAHIQKYALYYGIGLGLAAGAVCMAFLPLVLAGVAAFFVLPIAIIAVALFVAIANLIRKTQKPTPPLTLGEKVALAMCGSIVLGAIVFFAVPAILAGFGIVFAGPLLIGIVAAVVLLPLIVYAIYNLLSTIANSPVYSGIVIGLIVAILFLVTGAFPIPLIAIAPLLGVLFKYRDKIRAFFGGEPKPPKSEAELIAEKAKKAEQEAAQEAEKKAQTAAREAVQEAEKKAQEAEQKAEKAEEKAREAEGKAQVAEKKAEKAAEEVVAAEAATKAASTKFDAAEAKVGSLTKALADAKQAVLLNPGSQPVLERAKKAEKALAEAKKAFTAAGKEKAGCVEKQTAKEKALDKAVDIGLKERAEADRLAGIAVEARAEVSPLKAIADVQKRRGRPLSEGEKTQVAQGVRALEIADKKLRQAEERQSREPGEAANIAQQQARLEAMRLRFGDTPSARIAGMEGQLASLEKVARPNAAAIQHIANLRAQIAADRAAIAAQAVVVEPAVAVVEVAQGPEPEAIVAEQPVGPEVDPLMGLPMAEPVVEPVVEGGVEQVVEQKEAEAKVEEEKAEAEEKEEKVQVEDEKAEVEPEPVPVVVDAKAEVEVEVDEKVDAKADVKQEIKQEAAPAEPEPEPEPLAAMEAEEADPSFVSNTRPLASPSMLEELDQEVDLSASGEEVDPNFPSYVQPALEPPKPAQRLDLDSFKASVFTEPEQGIKVTSTMSGSVVGDIRDQQGKSETYEQHTARMIEGIAKTAKQLEGAKAAPSPAEKPKEYRIVSWIKEFLSAKPKATAAQKQEDQNNWNAPTPTPPVK